MGTPTSISEMFSIFLLNVRDYHILGLDMGLREFQLMDYLESSVAEFNTIFTNEQDYIEIDTANERFNKELPRRIKDIVIAGMLCRWISPYVLDGENLANNINLKELPQYSPANMLDKLNLTQERLQERFESEVNKYSFQNGDVEGLKV